MIKSDVNISLENTNEKIRKINGGNLGPCMTTSYHATGNTEAEFTALNSPLTRLHDAPYTNPGRRLVDIPQIFSNMDADPEDPASYYFDETDDYIQTILDCGSKVMYRLGVSIEHGKKRYHLGRPKDVKKYAAICANIIRHMNYGKWNGHHFGIEYWEIWNEPENWDWKNKEKHMPKQWDGTLEEFNKFYCELASILKAEFPELKIGGPSHGAPMKNGKEFLDYCKAHNAPLDFYSYHLYSDSVEKHRDLVFDVRRMLDEAGYPETESHLNEWHYHPTWSDEYWFNMTLAEQRVFQSEYYENTKGLDSAAMICSVLTAWQDAPLDMGGYYITCDSNAYGIFTGVNVPTPSYYGLKAFGDIVRYPERFRCEAAAPVYALAGKDENGCCAALISSYRAGTGSGEITVNFDRPVEISQVELLDEKHDLEKIYFEQEDQKIRLAYNGNSGVFLIKFKTK